MCDYFDKNGKIFNYYSLLYELWLPCCITSYCDTDSIDELENLHADRTTVCFEPW